MEEDKDRWLMSGFLSQHFNTDKKYNENNTGIGYRNEDGYLGGIYKNSLGKTSVYGGKEFSTDKERALRLAIILGLVTGYNKPITPMAVPEIVLGNKNHELALGLIPPIGKEVPGTAALQYRKRF